MGGALLAGFVLFITARDRLSVYGAVLWGAKPGAGAAPSTGSAVVPAPGTNPANPNVPSVPSIGKLLDPFDWQLPEGFLH